MNMFSRYRFVRVVNLVSYLILLCVLCGNTSAQQWRTAHDGVEYAEVRRELSGKPVNINLLRLDLKKVRLDVHHAMDAAIGTEKTSSIATRHGAVAAINAGFFRLDTSIWAGQAAGIVKVDGMPWSDPTSRRIAMFIDNRTAETLVSFDHLETTSWFERKGRKLMTTGLNRERRENDLIEFTPHFHRTTLTSIDGIEAIVRDRKVVQIRTNIGNSMIPQDGYVLSASGTKKQELLNFLAVGNKLDRYSSVSANPGSMFSPSSFSFEDITNGVPQLIKDSKIDITWEQEKASKSFVETRHPRTAVAKLKDGKFLMLTVDGRTEESAGLDLYDLAKLMLELGATDAMNLDGGGSTTMFLDGKVMNKPSDKEGERKVGDAILVTLRKNPPSKKK